MAYITPFTEWTEATDPAPEDLNRIEGNTKYNKDTADTDRATVTANKADIDSKVDQNLNTTSSPTFTSVTTGNYKMVTDYYSQTTTGAINIVIPNFTGALVVSGSAAGSTRTPYTSFTYNILSETFSIPAAGVSIQYIITIFSFET